MTKAILWLTTLAKANAACHTLTLYAKISHYELLKTDCWLRNLWIFRYAQNDKVPQKFPHPSKKSKIFHKPKKIPPNFPTNQNFPKNFRLTSPKFLKNSSKIKNSVRPKTIHYYICKNFHFTDKEFMDFSPFYKRLKMTNFPQNFHKFYKNLQI